MVIYEKVKYQCISKWSYIEGLEINKSLYGLIWKVKITKNLYLAIYMQFWMPMNLYMVLYERVRYQEIGIDSHSYLCTPTARLCRCYFHTIQHVLLVTSHTICIVAR